MKEEQEDEKMAFVFPDLTDATEEIKTRDLIREASIISQIQEHLTWLANLTSEMHNSLHSWRPEDPKQREKDQVWAEYEEQEHKITVEIIEYLKKRTLRLSEKYLTETFRFESVKEFRKQVSQWSDYRSYIRTHGSLEAKKELMNEVGEMVASLSSVPREYAKDFLKRKDSEMTSSFSPDAAPETFQKIKDVLWEAEESKEGRTGRNHE